MAKKQTNNNLERTGFIFSHLSNAFGFDAVSMLAGYTTDGKVIICGLAKFYFEYGIPFYFIFDAIKKHNMIPSWIHLVQELQQNGMPKNRIYHLLNESIFESYGKEFRDHVINKLKELKLL